MSNRKAEGFVSVHPRPLLFLLFEAALNESDFSLSFVFQEVAMNHCQPTKCPLPCDSPRCSLNAVQDSSERERERTVLEVEIHTTKLFVHSDSCSNSPGTTC